MYRDTGHSQPEVKFATATYAGNPLGLKQGAELSAEVRGSWHASVLMFHGILNGPDRERCMQDDGTLVVYTKDDMPAWHSATGWLPESGGCYELLVIPSHCMHARRWHAHAGHPRTALLNFAAMHLPDEQLGEDGILRFIDSTSERLVRTSAAEGQG